jgi:hypothetical protein
VSRTAGRGPAPPRPRTGDLVVWEEPTSWARGGVTYRVGTAAQVRRDGQITALADHHGVVHWRAAWQPASRPPITRSWHLPAAAVDVAGVLAAVRARPGYAHSLAEVRAQLAPFLRAPQAGGDR